MNTTKDARDKMVSDFQAILDEHAAADYIISTGEKDFVAGLVFLYRFNNSTTERDKAVLVNMARHEYYRLGCRARQILGSHIDELKRSK